MRRYLHYSKTEWARLSWIDQHTYIEGLARDGLLKGENTGGEDSAATMPLETFEAAGMTVRRH